MATLERTFPLVRPRYTGVLEWITTTDHKKIGVLYLTTTFCFFLAGGLLALGMRTQLATPDTGFLSASAYNEAFTMHGTTMVFLFVVPVPHRRGHPPALLSDGRDELLRGGTGRRPAALALLLLVLRAPRGLHHDPARLRRDQRSAAGLLAKADFWVPDDRLLVRRDRLPLLRRVRPPHVRRGHRSSSADLLHAVDDAHRSSDRREDLLVARHDLGRRLTVPDRDALRDGVHRHLHHRRDLRDLPRVRSGGRAAVRHVLRRRAHPLRPRAGRALLHVRGDVLLDAEDHRAHAERDARTPALLPLLHRREPRVLPDAPARP